MSHITSTDRIIEERNYVDVFLLINVFKCVLINDYILYE